MYQQQNYTNYYPQRTISLKGRPVTSLDEAKASPIDFDGTVFYFPDVANNCIYTKQINMDGTVSLNLYTLTDFPVAAPAPMENPNYITREEFEQSIQALKDTFLKKKKQTQEFKI